MMKRNAIGLVFLLTALGSGCAKPPETIDIHQADEQQKNVTIEATGQDLDVVNLKVTAARHGFDFVIPAGTMLLNGSGNHQNMMVARGVTISFKDATQPLVQTVSLDVYCVNLFKDVPTSDNVFSVGSYEPQSPLVKFVQCLENSPEHKDIRRLAVWIMSDNPTWEQYITRDRIDMILNRDMMQDLIEKLTGLRPTESQMDEIMIELRNIPDDQLREEMKPAVTDQLLSARKLFRECNVSTYDGHLFRDLPD